jgi:hypothetical protein
MDEGVLPSFHWITMAALFVPVPVQNLIESKVVDAAEGVGCPKMSPKVRRGSKRVFQPKLELTTKAYFKVTPFWR